MSTEQLLTELQPLVAGVAQEFGARHWRHGANSDDFAQELYVWLIENEERVREWMEDREPQDFDRYLAKVLRNECRDYGRDIKAQALGYDRSDEFFYSRPELEYLLTAMFDPEAWLNPPQSDGRSTKAPAEGNNWATTLSDVKAGFSKLSIDDQVLLRTFHEEGRFNHEVAEAYGVTESAMSYRHGRAVKRLADHLGGEVPKPARAGSQVDPWRGRHAVTNAAARAQQDNYYEES